MKYADLTATFAAFLSAYAIYNTNKQASITHVDTTRPRLIIDESIADSGLIHSNKQGEMIFGYL